ANLIGEIGWGVRVDVSRANPLAWAVICPLADPSRFFGQLDVLLKHFGVPITREATDPPGVCRSILKVPFAFGPSCGCCVVADSAATIAEIKPMTELRQPRSTALSACLERLPMPNLCCMVVDFAGLR